jgi:predicted nucleic acid-binding protein
MTFADIPAGTAVFLDANVFVYYFGPDPVFGPPCKQLLDRIEQKEVEGYISAHVLVEISHRLMTLEAMSKFGWAMQGMANV